MSWRFLDLYNMYYGFVYSYYTCLSACLRYFMDIENDGQYVDRISGSPSFNLDKPW